MKHRQASKTRSHFIWSSTELSLWETEGRGQGRGVPDGGQGWPAKARNQQIGKPITVVLSITVRPQHILLNRLFGSRPFLVILGFISPRSLVKDLGQFQRLNCQLEWRSLDPFRRPWPVLLVSPPQLLGQHRTMEVHNHEFLSTQPRSSSALPASSLEEPVQKAPSWPQ